MNFLFPYDNIVIGILILIVGFGFHWIGQLISVLNWEKFHVIKAISCSAGIMYALPFIGIRQTSTAMKKKVPKWSLILL